jgi:hypothetical protein
MKGKMKDEPYIPSAGVEYSVSFTIEIYKAVKNTKKMNGSVPTENRRGLSGSLSCLQLVISL